MYCCLRRPPARRPARLLVKDCQLFLHWAGSTLFDVVHFGRAVGYCVEMKSCGLRRHGNEPLACCQAYAMFARRATQSNARREPRAVLLSSVCNVCPRGDTEQRETAVTCDPAGRCWELLRLVLLYHRKSTRSVPHVVIGTAARFCTELLNSRSGPKPLRLSAGELCDADG